MKFDKDKLISNFKKFWHYIWHDDSFGSYILNFLFVFIIIKFMFFPIIGFALNNDYPIVAIVSGSMEHKVVNSIICDKSISNIKNKDLDLNTWWELCGSYYNSNYGITLPLFKTFNYENGLNIGDVMVLYGKDPQKIEVGEVLVFIPTDRSFFINKGPVIHRVVKKWKDESGKYHFQTKGDHNPLSMDNFEHDIPQEDVIGVGVIRIPYIGYAKLALNNLVQKIIN